MLLMKSQRPTKPSHKSTPHMIGRARSLRKTATYEERVLWYRLRLLRSLGFTFRRQSPFDAYVLDFVCHNNRVVVELDGSQRGLPDHQERDAERDRFLLKEGYRTIRLANWQVKDDPDWAAGYVVRRARREDKGEGESNE